MWSQMTWAEKHFLLMSLFTTNLFVILTIAATTYLWHQWFKKSVVYPDDYIQNMWFTFIAHKHIKNHKNKYVLFDGKSYRLVHDKQETIRELEKRVKDLKQ